MTASVLHPVLHNGTLVYQERLPAVCGYAVLFGQLSRPDGDGEFLQFERGAFTASLQSSRGTLRLLWRHDESEVLADASEGTFSVREDSRGLHWIATLQADGLGRHIHGKLRRGELACSIAGGVRGCKRTYHGDNGEVVRCFHVHSCRLDEISLTPFESARFPLTTAWVDDREQLSPGERTAYYRQQLLLRETE